MENGSFLSKFQSSAIALLKEGDSFGAFISAYRKQEPATPIPYDFDTLTARLDAIRQALQVVYAILEKPVIKAHREEAVSRSERVGRLDASDFRKTMRDPGVWREKAGELVPEYVHHEEYGDTIKRYENSFVILLLGQIERDLRDLESELLPAVAPFEAIVERGGLDFGKHSPLTEFEGQDLPYSSVFRQVRSDASNVYALARRIRKMLKNVTGTEFYRILSKEKPIDPEVIPTNILLHDPRYNKLFRFYEERYRAEGKFQDDAQDVLYYNYVLLSMFAFLSRKKALPKKGKLSLDPVSGRFHFETFSYGRGPFEIRVEENKEALGFYLTSRLSGEPDPKKANARYRVLVSKDLDEGNLALYEKLSEREEGEEDCFLITMNDATHRFDRVLSISYYEGKEDERFARLFLSLRMLFKCDSSLFYERCPVCGDRHTRFDGYENECQACGARYRSFGKGRLAKLWITRFRKERKGENDDGR